MKHPKWKYKLTFVGLRSIIKSLRYSLNSCISNIFLKVSLYYGIYVLVVFSTRNSPSSKLPHIYVSSVIMCRHFTKKVYHDMLKCREWVIFKFCRFFYTNIFGELNPLLIITPYPHPYLALRIIHFRKKVSRNKIPLSLYTLISMF